MTTDIRKMKDIDKNCGNCVSMNYCDNPENLHVCPEWEENVRFFQEETKLWGGLSEI